MADFHLSAAQHRQPFAPPPPQQGGVDWYSSGGQYAHGAYAYDAAAASSSAGNFGSFEDEAPLLEELGIDIPAIVSRTRSILTFRLGGHDLDELDLGGPLIYMALLGFAHLLVGKLHFGYILGWTVVGSAIIWFVLNSIAGPDPDAQRLDLYSCCCLLGYSLLPLVLHALFALLLPRRSRVVLGAAVATVLWSSATAARLFVRRSPALRGQQSIVMYPCLLMYAAFVLLTLY